MRVPGKLTDSTTGAATETLDDNTASVKDDLASLAAKDNAIIDCLRELAARVAALEAKSNE